MIKLSYDHDEVRDFHPVVMAALVEVLEEMNLDAIIEVIHHYPISGSTITPDFVLRRINTRKILFVLEVKVDIRDVTSQRYWVQTRGYVNQLSSQWQVGPKYFAITNIEKMISFADRTGSDLNCVLSGNPYDNGRFDQETGEAAEVVNKFKEVLRQILPGVIAGNAPSWAEEWRPIADSLSNTLNALTGKLDEEEARNMSAYELLRLLFYSFLKEYYSFYRNENTEYFRILPTTENPSRLLDGLRHNFQRVLDLDFEQLFKDNPDSSARIIPEKFDKNVSEYFLEFSETLSNHMRQAVSENHSPEYLLNLLTEKVYQREELHGRGKIMSDSTLAGLLAALTITETTEKVIDPGCGDGALLDAAYEAIRSHKDLKHDEILLRLTGYDVDPFLTQLASFRLLMKNANSVNVGTRAMIEFGDIFDHPAKGQFDAVVMNPPFLRNDDPVFPISDALKEKMLRSIEAQTKKNSFVRDATQPNLYFYFVNYAWHYVSDRGKAAFILMSKFMGSKDGEHLKEFILPNVSSVISYPRSFFNDFRVTTTVIVLSAQPEPNVKFLRVNNLGLLESSQEVQRIISENSLDKIEADFSLKVVDRAKLSPKTNWKVYLVDPKGYRNKLDNIEILAPITKFFAKVGRGSSENSGGSKLVFLDSRNQFHGAASQVESEFKMPGLRKNNIRRSLILNDKDLSIEPGLRLPAPYDSSSDSGLPEKYEKFEGLRRLYSLASSEVPQWRAIVNSAHGSQIAANLIIPRADRVKHTVYINASGEKILLSTNFCYCSEPQSFSEEIDESMQVKFVAAYLVSSFGQLQFELLGANQEGMRKIEVGTVRKFKVIDPKKVSMRSIQGVATAFEKLSASEQTFSGREGLSGPRQELDLRVAEALFENDSLGFDSPEKMANFFVLFLADLVLERSDE